MTKSDQGTSGSEEPLFRELASSWARWGITTIDYLSQDRPGLAVIARALPCKMASPTDGAQYCLKKVMHYLAAHQGGELMLPRGQV